MPLTRQIRAEIFLYYWSLIRSRKQGEEAKTHHTLDYTIRFTFLAGLTCYWSQIN
jgi:hypothetical protein